MTTAHCAVLRLLDQPNNEILKYGLMRGTAESVRVTAEQHWQVRKNPNLSVWIYPVDVGLQAAAAAGRLCRFDDTLPIDALAQATYQLVTVELLVPMYEDDIGQLLDTLLPNDRVIDYAITRSDEIITLPLPYNEGDFVK